MTTERLYEFLILSKLLNYSKAAENLYISQSMLTKHIQELESEIGTVLLKRTTHGVSLTDAGNILANSIPPLLDKCDSTARRLRTETIRDQGSVRIGIALEFSYSAHIRDFIHSFLSAYPDIDCKYDVLTAGITKETMQNYDLVFTPCQYHGLDEKTEMILSKKYGTIAVIPAGHPLMSKSAISLYQLAGETIIVPLADELFGPYAQNWMLIQKSTRNQVSVIKVENISTALFLVSMSKGICIAPQHIRNMLPNECFTVGVSDRNCRFDEYLYYNERENSAAKLFFDEYSQTLQNN